MNIQEIEKRTGVPKQNIRFYEKEGLIHPERNTENGYRQFSEADVERLKLIKLFRKLDLPIGTISELLEGKLELNAALEEQILQLQERHKELEACISFCEELKKEPSVGEIDADQYLEDMTEKEKAGNKFFDFLSDVKAVYDADMNKFFEFMPHTIIRTKRDFTDALFEYANRKNLNLVITKEGMYPEFLLNGVAYFGECTYSRFGANVICRLMDPEAVEPVHVSRNKRKWIRRMIYGVSLIILFLISFLFFFYDHSLYSLAGTTICALGVVAYWIAVIRTYPTGPE